MILKQFAWPFDPTGEAASNLIRGETHTLAPDTGHRYHYFIPKAAPFFVNKKLRVVHVQTGRELLENIDYTTSFHFEIASKRTYLPVYGAISVLDKTLNGAFQIDYQTIGGEWTLDPQALLEILSNNVSNPRVTTWEKVLDKPVYFPPIEHRFDVDNLIGMDETVEVLDRIKDAILSAANSIYPALNAHLQDKSNPHGTNKTHVGLGNVPNYGMASEAEAEAGVRQDRLMSPYLVAIMIAKLSSETVAGHTADKNNPHGVNKTQVGLGNVPNFAMATDAQAIDKTVADALMSPRLVWLAVKSWVGDTLEAHIARKDNPHGTTKSHVGLSNVPNFGLATVTAAETGLGNDAFMTPELTAKAIAKQAGASGIQSHVLDKDNPHDTTKAHVGLGNVPNYAAATQAEAEAGTANDKLMTPFLVAAAIQTQALAPLSTHANRKDNPHQVTKAQVGLDLVPNFPLATVDEVADGTATNRLVSVAQVVTMIAQRVGQSLTNHLADRNNPHGTTKAQVGLSDVPNFRAANDIEAVAGAAQDLLMTPYTTKLLIENTMQGQVGAMFSPRTVVPPFTFDQVTYTRLCWTSTSTREDAVFEVVGGQGYNARQPVGTLRLWSEDGTICGLDIITADEFVWPGQFGFQLDAENGRVIVWCKSPTIRTWMTVTTISDAGDLNTDFSQGIGVTVTEPAGITWRTPRSVYTELTQAFNDATAALA